MQNKNYRNDNVYRGVLSCTITDLSVEAKKKRPKVFRKTGIKQHTRSILITTLY
jgi:hypothetical protein